MSSSLNLIEFRDTMEANRPFMAKTIMVINSSGYLHVGYECHSAGENVAQYSSYSPSQICGIKWCPAIYEDEAVSNAKILEVAMEAHNE